jgi:hypothetical protein
VGFRDEHRDGVQSPSVLFSQALWPVASSGSGSEAGAEIPAL